MIRNGPASSPVEVALNGSKVGTGTTGETGDVTVPLSVGGAIPATGLDANIYVDYCDKLRRVQIVERTKIVPAAEPGCDRHEISGLFWVRPVNTIVFDLGGASPSLLLVRGSYVYRAPKEEDAPHIWRPLPTGLLVYGGLGLAKLSDAFSNTCGNASPCSGNDEGLGGYTFGADFWVKRWIAIEGSYIKPRQMTAQGGDTFNFNTKQDTDVFTIVGKGGIPAGPVRIFGEYGVNWHESTTTTKERIDLASQTFTLKTRGWGYVLGGGVEAWIWKKIAIYGDLGVMRVKGDSVTGGEAKLDDHVNFLFIGAKFRLSPK
jgi:hypothetical protein